MSDKQRGLGNRSFCQDVRLRPDAPCTLKRHFTGCLRQVVGLAEKLARNDPSRFIWASVQFFLKHAKKRSGETYGIRQVFYCLLTAELLGILVRSEQIRKGISRKGFIVSDHDALANKDSGRCIFMNKRKELLTLGGELLSATQSATQSAPRYDEGAVGSAAGSAEESDIECSLKCRADSSQSLDGSKDSDLDWATSDEDLAALTQSTQSTLKRTPLTRLPQTGKADSNGHTNSRSLSLSSSDLTSDLTRVGRRGVKRNQELIREHFKLRISASKSIIQAVSGGEFDVKYLKTYRHVSQLNECCLSALTELESEPFLGRGSYARVMGKAMELLRAVHQVDAPRGWVKVIRGLREHSEESDGKPPGYADPVFYVFYVEPGDVLTDSFGAAFHAFDSQAAESLDKKPEIKSAFVRLAQQRGVPGCWTEALDFMNQLLAEFVGNPPADLISLRERLAARVKEEEDATLDSQRVRDNRRPQYGQIWEKDQHEFE